MIAGALSNSTDSIATFSTDVPPVIEQEPWLAVAVVNVKPPLLGSVSSNFTFFADWLPLRMTAVTFAIVGDFEDAIYCWRTQARQWPSPLEGILFTSGAGALGCTIGGSLTGPTGEPEFRPELGLGEVADADIMVSAIGLVWRALLVWLVLLLLITLAYWAP